VILFDIAIHKEQNPEFGTYFNPSDAAEFALILSENTTSNNMILESDIQVAADNFMDYGLSYQTLVKQVVKSTKIGINDIQLSTKMASNNHFNHGLKSSKRLRPYLFFYDKVKGIKSMHFFMSRFYN